MLHKVVAQCFRVLVDMLREGIANERPDMIWRELQRQVPSKAHQACCEERVPTGMHQVVLVIRSSLDVDRSRLIKLGSAPKSMTVVVALLIGIKLLGRLLDVLRHG